ncbi:efflux RND transporter periplasmic adaptor subunit [Marinimicrobium sp. ABcell2]|uniref:efflux RND transporter periplasmic adaptor subunit n=1 Tax=Marinimicrobium sp. ABcell2 TaxID=3069751 RepID=UPI0027B548EC|nr:efflux RND transporter periplasmic adaptor subunit [Marinimicrobium sp. ABcell2]MDQ2075294.1 efflux RND transporter periplasmic adaptor subunit [Marinimicrobium sp. ABcell2]
MHMPKKRTLILTAVGAAVVIVIAYSFRAPAALVDSAVVERGHFQQVVEEEGRTRLPNRYQVSAPVAGYLSRVQLEPGDELAQGAELFRINPAPAVPLDARSRSQAEAALARAESALDAARTLVEAEQARAELAEAELERIERLVTEGHMPRESLDRAQAEARRAAASLRSARFGVDVARYERDSARASVAIVGGEQGQNPIPVNAPVGGVVLTRERQSEGMVQAGEPILTLGDLASLEVEVDVLSPDAVRLRPGMRVEIERWGGEENLPGRVRRVEPSGFTRFSALGVEEQRVWVIVDFDTRREHWQHLGDGYRVEARFILWEGSDVLQIPASALFREGDAWGVFVIENGRARHRSVTPGRRSGLMAEVRSGLSEGERVVLHPGQDIGEGSRVQTR